MSQRAPAPTPSEITTFLVETDEEPYVNGPPPPQPVEVVEHDAEWAHRFEELALAIRAALGPLALDVEHVGSTAVPGLAAKPVIDIDLTLADTRDEATYVPALEALGYELVIREPAWYEHRCLRLEEPRVNLHVFPDGCPELVRHRLFRDHLIAHADERAAYVAAKRGALGTDVTMEYNRRKEAVVREIYERAFRAAGLL